MARAERAGLSQRDPAAYQRLYYRENRERITRRLREKRDNNGWKTYRANYYQKHRAEVLERSRKKRDQVRQLIRRAKAKPCADCKNRYPYYVMDLDHVRGTKIAAVGSMLKSTNLQRVKDEIAKCEAVCANCHRKRTHQRKHEMKEAA